MRKPDPVYFLPQVAIICTRQLGVGAFETKIGPKKGAGALRFYFYFWTVPYTIL